MSILDLLSCGFAKIALYHTYLDKCDSKRQSNEKHIHFKGRLYKEQYKKFTYYFSDYQDLFNVDYKKFIDKFPAIVGNILSLDKRRVHVKKELLELFSLEQRNTLSDRKKREHRLHESLASVNNKVLH